jgi:LmbE family N-acetylglucosaminyl deacetylase
MSRQQHGWPYQKAAVIVAHPDDELLWAGGTILMHTETEWNIMTLCRKSDPDRAPRFENMLKLLNAQGCMADLDDGPAQRPLSERNIESTILTTLTATRFDLIITHGFVGEYTRHRRHEEAARSVYALWRTDKLTARALWMFAYEDGQKTYLPRAVRNADRYEELPEAIWERKYNAITQIYGFTSESFEAKTTPRNEAFWCLKRK